VRKQTKGTETPYRGEETREERGEKPDGTRSTGILQRGNIAETGRARGSTIAWEAASG